MSTSTMAHHGVTVAHALRGRTRLRSPKLKRYPHLQRDIGKQLSALPGIRQVESNPARGSVVLHHEPFALRSAEVLAMVVEILGVATLDPEELPELLETLEETELAGASDDVVLPSFEQLAERLDAKTLVPATLCLLGIRSLFVADILCPPKWYDYFWFAFGTYIALNPGVIPPASPSTSNSHGSSPNRTP